MRTTRRQPVGVLVLAVLAYVPALMSSPGRMPADTKLYLYLDPAGSKFGLATDAKRGAVELNRKRCGEGVWGSDQLLPTRWGTVNE